MSVGGCLLASCGVFIPPWPFVGIAVGVLPKHDEVSNMKSSIQVARVRKN